MLNNELTAPVVAVSVLFSEPKIPQLLSQHLIFFSFYSFSALQRAENSSMNPTSPRFASVMGFSALQRAENSSISRRTSTECGASMFQCSSASRKFLNRHPARRPANGESFSALQRAENSSIVPEQRRAVSLSGFSALQRAENSSNVRWTSTLGDPHCFSALQRAENSSNGRGESACGGI